MVSKCILSEECYLWRLSAETIETPEIENNILSNIYLVYRAQNNLQLPDKQLQTTVF